VSDGPSKIITEPPLAIEAERVLSGGLIDIPPAAAPRKNWRKGVNIAPGASTDQSAYRSEVVGLFALLPWFASLCAFHDITAGYLTLGATVVSALLNCTDTDYAAKPASPSFGFLDTLLWGTVLQ
jgi:hypothetical protein